jgi:DNA-binding NtrC family response regulator
MTLAEAEKRLILATLDAVAGDRKEAAATLGISVRTLYSRLALYRAAGEPA